MTCSRRIFLLGTATTLSGAVLAACSALGEQEPEPEHIAKMESKDIPVGGAVAFGNFFVAQPKEGVFKAYSAECTHQGGTVEIFENGKGRCREHNSTFDLETGVPVWGPARDPLEPAKLTNRGKTLYLQGKDA
ncbi:Rieske [2Fe-2S] domain protein [Corynebacterium kalinowskii]|uniref:Rieske [2Fe-2S] domain protein n=1 Tax=Corynebacterium kalinowskii TaxID=2675216 RepID=A0A6B8VWE6_9CORY|nr:Rieske (2Fe-2S) protein [Corynebacterium kalinowskii]QGU03255.1 Rieske [2Fe-2S] domain protein [Corynebacterium kalinowskii]